VTVAAPTEIVSTADLPATRSVAGTVRAATVSPLAAKVMGNVVAVHVREGDRVRAGQLLVEIDDREARTQGDRARAGRNAVERAIDGASAAVAAAEASASLAAANLQRFAALRERGSVSVAELDEARARSAVAAAELDRARRAREQFVAQRAEASAAAAQAGLFADYTKVRAPIDGIVSARFVDPGAQAAPGMPLLTVEDDRAARVDTSAPEDLAVREGDAVTIEAAGRRIGARVTRVVSALDPAARSALVKIDLPPGAGLRSGTFANVLFTSGARRAISIPAAALQQRGALAGVFVVGRDGIARLRLVTAGDGAGDRVEILSGLDAGETIVTQLRGIRDGARVR